MEGYSEKPGVDPEKIKQLTEIEGRLRMLLVNCSFEGGTETGKELDGKFRTLFQEVHDKLTM